MLKQGHEIVTAPFDTSLVPTGHDTATSGPIKLMQVLTVSPIKAARTLPRTTTARASAQISPDYTPRSVGSI